MFINAIAAAALVTASFAPAYASDPVAPAPAAKAKQEKTVKKERKYCVEVEMTGSRVARQVCQTRDQWIQSDGFDPIRHVSR